MFRIIEYFYDKIVLLSCICIDYPSFIMWLAETSGSSTSLESFLSSFVLMSSWDASSLLSEKYKYGEIKLVKVIKAMMSRLHYDTKLNTK